MRLKINKLIEYKSEELNGWLYPNDEDKMPFWIKVICIFLTDNIGIDAYGKDDIIEPFERRFSRDDYQILNITHKRTSDDPIDLFSLKVIFVHNKRTFIFNWATYTTDENGHDERFVSEIEIKEIK